MYKPKFTPISHHHADNPVNKNLPDCFTVFAWNLQKTDFSHYIHRSLNDLLKKLDPEIQPHILSFQEAKTFPSQNTFFNLPFIMAPNIQTKLNHFGVLTASSSIITPMRQCLTQSRELGWATHKTALITEHKLNNQQTLTHVNIHAINFVSHTIFNRELNKVWQHLEHLDGPIILSGDFNTWNIKRVQTLIHATQSLNLEKVEYPDQRPIKTMLRQPIDYIFFRGLHLHSSQAIDIANISDHNPILATFSTS